MIDQLREYQIDIPDSSPKAVIWRRKLNKMPYAVNKIPSGVEGAHVNVKSNTPVKVLRRVVK